MKLREAKANITHYGRRKLWQFYQLVKIYMYFDTDKVQDLVPDQYHTVRPSISGFPS